MAKLTNFATKISNECINHYHFFILLLSLLIVSSCGTSEADVGNPDEILALFADSDGKDSRGNVINLDALKASGVALKAYDAGTATVYDNIDGNCTWNGSRWSLPGGAHNWPRNGGALDFYAASSGIASQATRNGLYNMNVPGDRDDLYGIRPGQTKDTDGGGVNILMRHIYSKLKFNFGVDNSSLRLEVRRVSVVNSRNNADYYWSQDTHNSLGSWQIKNNDQYGRTIYARQQYDGSPLIVHYSATRQRVPFNADPFFVMPQPVQNKRPDITTSYDSGWESIHFPGTGDTYAFVAIDCRVMQYVPPTGSDTQGSYVAIWPTEGKYSYRNIILPLTDGYNNVTWEQEYAYTYEIRVGEGAGWQPDGSKVLFTVGLTAVLHGFDDSQKVYPDMQ